MRHIFANRYFSHTDSSFFIHFSSSMFRFIPISISFLLLRFFKITVERIGDIYFKKGKLLSLAWSISRIGASDQFKFRSPSFSRSPDRIFELCVKYSEGQKTGIARAGCQVHKLVDESRNVCSCVCNSLAIRQHVIQYKGTHTHTHTYLNLQTVADFERKV